LWYQNSSKEALFKVKNGNYCKFWQDCWLVEVLLMIAYDDIYKLVSEPNCCVSDCWVDGEWTMDFKRSLTVQEFNRWLNLKYKLQAVTLSHESNDSVSWALEKKGYFSTRSLYRFLTDRGVTSKVAGYIWRCKIPQKIKFFLWQVFNNKLQVASSLAKRGWKGDVHCCLCGRIESVNHILFHCYLAKLIWGMIREIFQLDFCPSSLEDFSYMWLQGKGPLPSHLLMFLFAGIAWHCGPQEIRWRLRNISLKLPLMLCMLLYRYCRNGVCCSKRRIRSELNMS
jgi:hypothetical protein